MELLSLVVPCFNEEETIQIYYDSINSISPQIPADIEFCFVDDGSKDKTASILSDLSKKDPRVHFVSFSRNFGKDAALLAGMEMSRGDYVVTMDVDLQDPPSLLPKMFEMLHDETKNYDCIATRRSSREGEPVIRSAFARTFYWLVNKMSYTEIKDGARDFRMMSRKMADAVIADREYSRFSKGIFSWVGFNTFWLEYPNIERSAGTTKWSFWKLFKYAIDGILAYSVKPLYIVSLVGVIMCLIAFIVLIIVVIRAAVWGDPVAGWPSLASIMIFMGGIVLLGLGIIGLYISKIYMETKKREIYIVRDRDTNHNTDNSN